VSLFSALLDFSSQKKFRVSKQLRYQTPLSQKFWFARFYAQKILMCLKFLAGFAYNFVGIKWSVDFCPTQITRRHDSDGKMDTAVLR